MARTNKASMQSVYEKIDAAQIYALTAPGKKTLVVDAGELKALTGDDAEQLEEGWLRGWRGAQDSADGNYRVRRATDSQKARKLGLSLKG